MITHRCGRVRNAKRKGKCLARSLRADTPERYKAILLEIDKVVGPADKQTRAQVSSLPSLSFPSPLSLSPSPVPSPFSPLLSHYPPPFFPLISSEWSRRLDIDDVRSSLQLIQENNTLTDENSKLQAQVDAFGAPEAQELQVVEASQLQGSSTVSAIAEVGRTVVGDR